MTLASFADEVVGTLARLLAYVGTLALLAILSVAALDQLRRLGDEGPAPGSDWAANGACDPGSIDGLMNSINKSIAYFIAGDAPGQDRNSCDSSGSPDWLRSAETVQLRGSL
ncbi:hypothetical protein [Bradyrhizobium sp.]|uniref:hypothetical protein n=1 Tax=Bradyrhizobium sp. TaxID=376 RepID=UPI00239DD710|nr:hypothetical protein [Bradyrhizobium sp.]MDE2378016.1 hypothetical protein [Bradyrhizobium sp.]